MYVYMYVCMYVEGEREQDVAWCSPNLMIIILQL